VSGAPSNLTDSDRKTMREQMAQRLQALLADRFHLAIHRETKEQQGYALVVAKGGPKIHAPENNSDERQGMMRMGRGSVEGHGVPLDTLIHAISTQLGRPVADRTGLTGHFDINLKWTPEPGQSTMPPGGGPEPPPPDPNGPSLFTALQEQLGLRLESEKARVETIIIDRVEKPSEN
jgi:bla regulator protein blaR1